MSFETQEFIDMLALFKEYVENCQTEEDNWDIMEEETAAYFTGDKSAEEMAHIIQSRVGRLLAE